MRKSILLGVATLLSAIAIPSVAFAGTYSPSNRATFQCITPDNCPGANYVTFNSFTNAPNYGDERGFLDAKDASITSAGGYQDNMTVRDGQKITLRVYIHNDANPNAIGEAAATAKNTKLTVLLPTNKKTSHAVVASVKADNANPGSVGDSTDFNGANPFTMAFDKGSPVQVTYRPNGQGDFVTRTLPSASFADDQTLNANFGDWKGCFNYGALITMTVVVHMDTPAPEVSFACTGLDVAPIDRNRATFTARAAAKNATVTSYTFTTKDSNGNVVTSATKTTGDLSATYDFNQSNPATYSVSAVVNTDKGSTNPADCTKQITVSVQPTTPVTLSATTGKSLPNTGAGDIAGLFAGASAAGAAGHYVVSRRRK